jgi:Outer membrane protein/protective antigen OMA87
LDRILSFGRSAWILPATILAEELVRAYHDIGFWRVAIDVQEDDKSIFVIKEGKRAQLDAVCIHNNKQGNEPFLVKHCFKKMMRHSFIERDMLQAAFDELLGWYMNHGFLEFKMVSHEFKECASNHYELHITLDEGPQTLIDTITIEKYPELLLQGPFVLALQSGKPLPFDPVMVHEQRQWLLKHFHDKGYLQAAVSHSLQRKNDQSVLEWRVVLGDKIRFGKTIVQGSSSLPTELIMRELKYQEDEIWDPKKVRASFLRLKELKIFESVSFAPLASGQLAGVRPVLLKLQQDDPFELRVRAGLELQDINQYQTFGGLAYKVGGSFIVKNPTNHADQFRFDADVATSHRELNCSYNYPWIFNLPIDGVIQGYGIKYDQPGFIGSKNNLYTYYQHGGLIGLRHKTAILDAGANLGFEIARTSINRDDVASRIQADRLAIALDFNPALLNKRVPFVFFEPTVMVNLLDNNLNPSRGNFSLLSCKGMFPTNDSFAQSFFIKVLVEHSFFFPVGPVVTAWRLRVGHIFHRLFADVMPSERFYLGGANSVRSYQTDHAPPLGVFIDDDGNSQLVPRGGKTMVNMNAELRIPTFKNVGLVLFQDMGVLSGDAFAGFHANNIVAGTGVGVRLFTPIGPLRLDVACKWKKLYPRESRLNWFLTFGQAF